MKKSSKKALIKVVSILIVVIFIIIAKTKLSFFMNGLEGEDLFMANFILSFIIILCIGLPVFLLLNLIFCVDNKRIGRQINKQEIPEEFDKIYNELCSKYFDELENMRRNLQMTTIIQTILMIIFFVGYIGIDSGKIEDDNSIVLVFSFICFIISGILIYTNGKQKKIYAEKYKKNIISNFVNILNKDLSYTASDDSKVSNYIETYNKTNFESLGFNRFSAEDFLEGVIDNDTFVEMADIDVKLETGSGKNKRVIDIFSGIFAHVISNNNIQMNIKISKNKSTIIKRYSKVEMDSSEFEECFDVFAENRLEAMKILNHEVMEKFVNFHRTYNIDFEVILKHNEMFLRFFVDSMFEPRIFGNSMDKEFLVTYFCILRFIIEVTRELNKIAKETVM